VSNLRAAFYELLPLLLNFFDGVLALKTANNIRNRDPVHKMTEKLSIEVIELNA
jgi:hypothetical protein